MRVIVNGEQREISSARIDALLGELEYEGTHFAIALNYRRAAEEPLGRNRDQERRRDRDHHAAAGRVRMSLQPTLPSSPGLNVVAANALEYWIPAFAGMTARVWCAPLLPSPLRGGVGGRGPQAQLPLWPPPTPTLPRKGGGSSKRRR